MPTQHKIATRQEWLTARLELLAAAKELTRRSDELARQRQELPWVRIDKEYRFETDEGSVGLADLFRGRSQLLVYHFMFGPDPATYTRERPGMSAFALEDGVVYHTYSAYARGRAQKMGHHFGKMLPSAPGEQIASGAPIVHDVRLV